MATDILVKIGADITDFSRKMAESNRALSNFTSTNQRTFDAFKQTGKAVTGAGLALAGGLGATVKVASDFSTQMSKVKAISGATDKEFALLNDTAKHLGATTVFSASQAAEGMEYLALAGWKTGDIVKAMPGMLDLAAAGALDLGRAADITSDTMSAFGLSADQATHAADVFAYAQANANTSVEQMGEAMNYLAPTANSLGWSLEESSAIIMELANNGLKGSMATQAFGSSLVRLASPTPKASKLIKKLGMEFFDAEENMKSMPEVLAEMEKGLEGMSEQQKAAAMDVLVGKNAYKQWQILLDAGSDSLADMTKELENADGTAADMAETMLDNLGGSVILLKSALEGAAITIGETLTPYIQKATEWINKLVDWFNELSPSTQRYIVLAAALGAALMLITGPILMLIGYIPQMITLFNSVVTVIKLVGKAAMLLTSPWGLVIAAVIVAVVLIVKYWEPIKEFFIQLWEKIKEAGIAIWDWLKGVWETTVEAFKEIFTPIIEKALEIWELIKTGAEAAWELIKNAVLGVVLLFINLLTGNFEEFKTNLSQIWDNIKTAAETIWNSISGIFSIVWDAIKETVGKALDWIDEKTNGKFSIYFDLIKGYMDLIWGVIEDVWGFIKNTFSNVLDFIKSLVKGDFKGMKDAIKNQTENARDLISNIWGRIKTFFGDVLLKIWQTVKDKFNDVVTAARDKMEEAKKKVEDAWEKAVEFLKSIDLMQIGKDVINGFINGIKSKVSDVAAAAKEAADAVTGKIKSILNIHSPSRVLAQIGRWTGEGLAKGIVQTTNLVGRATAKLAEAATPDAPAISLAYDTPSGIRSSLLSAVNGTVDVNARDDMIAGAIDDLRRDLTNLRVEMDKREVGRIVAPTVGQELNDQVSQTIRGRGRRSI